MEIELIKTLKCAESNINGTSLVTFYLPANYDL